MKPKKQASIYVARDNTTCGVLRVSFVEMSKINYRKELVMEGHISSFTGGVRIKEKERINIEKGEQVRIPIDIDRTEVV